MVLAELSLPSAVRLCMASKSNLLVCDIAAQRQTYGSHICAVEHQAIAA